MVSSRFGGNEAGLGADDAATRSFSRWYEHCPDPGSGLVAVYRAAIDGDEAAVSLAARVSGQ